MVADRDLTDPALDALLRARLNETPPAHVDAAILAAAHRAVDSEPRQANGAAGPWPWRWWMPLAAAATIGAVAIGVLQVAPTVSDVTTPVSDSPRAAPVAPDSPGAAPRGSSAAIGETSPSSPAAAMQPAPTSSHVPAARAKRDSAGLAAERRPSARPERANAPEPFPLQKSQSANAAAAPPTSRAAPQRESAAGASASLPAPRQDSAAAAAPPSAASRHGSAATADSLRADDAGDIEARRVAEWISRIRALRNGGKLPEAAQALIQFRAAYADADSRLPADLRAWAESIAR